MTAVAYIRKSKANPNGHTLSWEVQEAQVRELAERHGEGAELLILSDWGSSGAAAAGALGGTGRGGKRKVWAHLVQMIEERQVTSLYAYSLSRLARSTRELLDLAERCANADVVVRLAKEGTLDFRSAHGRLYLTVLAAVATFEADVSAERARDQVALRRGRGEHIGQPPYGFRLDAAGKLEPEPSQPIGPVLDAYAEAGTFHGAARILNGRAQPSRGGTPWSDMTVRRVVARINGQVTPARPGRPPAAPALLGKLLRCHCGGPMTPARDHQVLATGERVAYQQYLCWRSRHDPDHSRPAKVSESALLPWIRAEAARFRAPEAVELEEQLRRGEDSRDQLLAKRQRIIDNYEDGLIGREERAAKVAAIDGDLERLDQKSLVTMVVPPAIDWDRIADVEAVNAFLRAIWDHVQLGPDLRPVRAEWGVPPEYVAPSEALA